MQIEVFYKDGRSLCLWGSRVMNPPVSLRFLLNLPQSVSDSVFSKIVFDLSSFSSQILQLGGGCLPCLWAFVLLAYGFWFPCPICRVSQKDCIEQRLQIRRYDDINFILQEERFGHGPFGRWVSLVLSQIWFLSRFQKLFVLLLLQLRFRSSFCPSLCKFGCLVLLSGCWVSDG